MLRNWTSQLSSASHRVLSFTSPGSPSYKPDLLVLELHFGRFRRCAPTRLAATAPMVAGLLRCHPGPASGYPTGPADQAPRLSRLCLHGQPKRGHEVVMSPNPESSVTVVRVLGNANLIVEELLCQGSCLLGPWPMRGTTSLESRKVKKRQPYARQRRPEWGARGSGTLRSLGISAALHQVSHGPQPIRRTACHGRCQAVQGARL